MAASFRELYQRPGVKATRAGLFDEAGCGNPGAIASASSRQIIRDTTALILQTGLALKAPLPKEVKTHIAVAKALTIYAV